MFTLTRASVVAVLFCFLSACATVKNPAKTQKQEQSAKSAKINAQLGIAYLERHNLPLAKQKLLLAMEQGPDLPETWYSMAYYQEATGNKDDASIYYQKAVSIAPNRGDAQNNYGTFLCRNGDYQGSVEHFLLAVKDPTHLNPADAYENAGLCAAKIPNKQLAAKYFAKALEQDPSRITSQKKLAELDDSFVVNDEKPVFKAPVIPKRIAYNSLRHRQDEDEGEEGSGLVKISEVLKARPAMVASAKSIARPRPPIDTSNVSAEELDVVRAKPIATARLKKAIGHEFHVERVALKPESKTVKPIKAMAKLKDKTAHKPVASKTTTKIAMAKPTKRLKLVKAGKLKAVRMTKLTKPKQKVKVAHTVPTKKRARTDGMVMV